MGNVYIIKIIIESRGILKKCPTPYIYFCEIAI